MPAHYVVQLEAETGKAFVIPFYSLDGLRDYGHIHSPTIRKVALLPDPLRLFWDGLAEYDGKAINFIASAYCGAHCKHVLFGDVFVCRADAQGRVTGLTREELRYVSLDLERSFGIRLPIYASA